MRILQAIHDFLPRHRAGSELYALHLSRELARRHDVRVLCAEFDPERTHGSLTARSYEGLAVLELVNNWSFADFGETYRSRALAAVLARVLDELRPDVLHVHSLLNLSFELPALARARGIPCVATLHDYTLVCPSGGQRVHVAEEHVCREIEPERCARCFPDSPFYSRLAVGRAALPVLGLGPVKRMAGFVRLTAPALFASLERAVGRGAGPRITAEDIERRLEAVSEVAETVELFVAPSRALAMEYVRLGLPSAKVAVSGYGFVPLPRVPRAARGARLRFGFVGTLVWHKGAHVLLEAARALPAGRFEIVLFGDPHTFPAYAARLRRMAEGLPVRFAGAFEESEAARVYAEMDVLVVPSLWLENSPLVIHEAFEAGVPVIGSDMGGIPELVRHGMNGLVYPAFSAGALVEAMRSLIEDPARVDALAQGLPHVKTIAEDARGWEAIYARVGAGSRAGEAARA